MSIANALSTEFGYCPDLPVLEAGDFRVEPLAERDEAIQYVLSSSSVEADWIYAPRHIEEHRLGFPARIVERPYSSRVFDLPKTNALKSKLRCSESRVDFLLWGLSFLTGMRLSAKIMAFIDSTPIKRGNLVDFHSDRSALETGIVLVDEFWRRNQHSRQVHVLFEATIHLMFFAQNRNQLSFESLVWRYTALDTLFALLCELYEKPRRLRHSERVKWICDKLGLQTPSWGRADHYGKSTLSVARNQAIHEGLHLGAPLGFSFSAEIQNVLEQIVPFLCRALTAILSGKVSVYSGSRTDTRQRYKLEF